jgi:hypothetical protein
VVAEYVTGLKAAWEVAKALKTASDAVDDATLKMQTAELMSALADAKIQGAELQALLLEKDAQISELKAQLLVKEKIEYDGQCYWSVGGDQKDGPFCQKCYDTEDKLVRLQDGSSKWEGRTKRWLKCYSCSATYHL